MLSQRPGIRRLELGKRCSLPAICDPEWLTLIVGEASDPDVKQDLGRRHGMKRLLNEYDVIEGEE